MSTTSFVGVVIYCKIWCYPGIRQRVEASTYINIGNFEPESGFSTKLLLDRPLVAWSKGNDDRLPIFPTLYYLLTTILYYAAQSFFVFLFALLLNASLTVFGVLQIVPRVPESI
jgi:hypothetical protein